MKLFLPAAGLALFALLIGCETDNNEETTLSINPPKAKVAYGQTITLTAQGGWDYVWSLQQPAHGTLSSYNGKEVSYTAPDAPDPSSVSSNAPALTDKVYVSSASNQTAKAVITILDLGLDE